MPTLAARHAHALDALVLSALWILAPSCAIPGGPAAGAQRVLESTRVGWIGGDLDVAGAGGRGDRADGDLAAATVSWEIGALWARPSQGELTGELVRRLTERDLEAAYALADLQATLERTTAALLAREAGGASSAQAPGDALPGAQAADGQAGGMTEAEELAWATTLAREAPEGLEIPPEDSAGETPAESGPSGPSGPWGLLADPAFQTWALAALGALSAALTAVFAALRGMLGARLGKATAEAFPRMARATSSSWAEPRDPENGF